jgi:hypothetical protein
VVTDDERKTSRAGPPADCAGASWLSRTSWITIKKYANRRLYNTGTSTYVTLEDLAVMVKAGEDFVVYDAKSGEDITRRCSPDHLRAGKQGEPEPSLSMSRGSSSASTATRCRCCAALSEVSTTSSRATRKVPPADDAGVRRRPLRRDRGAGVAKLEMFERTFAMFTPFAKRDSGGRARNPTRLRNHAGGIDDRSARWKRW